jgi:hypothetical protein
VLRAIARGIDCGELPPGTNPADVLDLLAGPVVYRLLVSGGTVDRAFARCVIDRVLAAYAPHPIASSSDRTDTETSRS